MGKSIADRIVEYEMGDMAEKEMLELFQELVDTGMAWRLQGTYGRTAEYLIEQEYIYDKKEGK
jgi:hypothetical protein